MARRNLFVHGGYWKYLLLAAVLLLTVFVPYHVPVRKVVSLSYVVGFSNRAAMLIFLAGALVFARLTRFRYGPQDTAEADHKLGSPSLLLASAITAVLLAAQFFSTRPHIAQAEAPYNINRLQMLVTHHIPYLQFEYAYGPLHLYLARLLGLVLQLSAFNAYYANWALQWMCGVPMLWYTVRHLQGPLRDRRLVFWGLFCLQIPSIFLEAISYTPIRMLGAAFLLVFLHRLWTTKGRLKIAWLASAGAVMLALSVSAEQGVSVTGGLLLWLTLLAAAAGRRLPWRYPVSLLLFTAAVVAVAYRMQYFSSAMQFSQGAFTFPLTLCIPVVLVLGTYAFGTCALVERIQQKDFYAQGVPLALGGLLLLPAALGRTDTGHLQAAAPLLLLGICYVLSHRVLRQPWLTAASLVFLLPALFIIQMNVFYLRRVLAQQLHSPVNVDHQRPFSAGPELVDHDGGVYLHNSGPCTTTYRVIDLAMSPRETAAQNCLDTGYFDGMNDILTPAALAKLIASLDQQPRRPILLLDGPSFEQEFNPRENLPQVLPGLQGSWYLPEVRHSAEDYASLHRYLLQQYVPAPEATGGLRVWNPK